METENSTNNLNIVINKPMEDILEINKAIRLLNSKFKLSSTLERRLTKLNNTLIARYRRQPFINLNKKIFLSFLKRVKAKIRVKVKEENKKKKVEAKIKARKEKKKLTDKKKEYTKIFSRLIRSKKFNEIFKLAIKNELKLTKRQTTKLFNLLKNGKKVITLEYSDRTEYKPVNDITKNLVFSLLEDGFILGEGQYLTSSDTQFSLNIEDLVSISIKDIEKPERVITNKDGKFFPYLNTTRLDLSKYQIFNQEQAYNKELLNRREHCLIHSLLLCGVDNAVANEVKMTFITGCNFRKKDLKIVANIIGRNIILHEMDRNENAKRNRKGVIKADEPKHEDIELCIYENHYFIYEKSIYSKFFINNYDELIEEEPVIDPYRIVKILNNKKKNKKYYVRADDRKIDSLSLIHKLLKQGKFGVLDMTKFEETSSHISLKNNIYLDNIENEQKEVEINGKKKNKNPPLIFYADCESFVYNPQHSLYLLGVVGDKCDKVSIFNVCDKYNEPGQQVVYDFMNRITNNGENNAIVYFHNLKYDYHLLEKFLNIRDKCVKDKQLYSVKAVYKGKKVELRDSYKLIPFGLSKFQKEFNLDKKYGKKEAISYKYYTEDNNNEIVKVSEYKKLLSFKEQEIFDKNMKIEPSYNKKTKTFNPLSYYKEYLKLDCLVLKKGIQKFNELIKGITEGKMSVYDSLTISSLTDKYMKIEGAYDGVYEVKANLREFIGKAVYGGRVCVNKKYKKKVIEGKIADYDGVSLYPSAIYRLCMEKGLMVGMAKRFTLDMDWKKCDYSILKVKINKVNKIQQMPFIAHKQEGSIKYSNEAPDEPIIIDSLTLEDYIKFHKIDFTIMDGVYWDEGFNNTMGKVINRLFNARLKYKKTNKALANTIKLMLNSSYGKTIMKKSITETKIVASNKTKKFNKKANEWETVEGTGFDSYVYNNFNTIKGWRKLNDYNMELEKIKADNTFNRAHIGCAILSMSKRIMNEVFDVANDNKLPIYYTDTDSLHCNFDDVPVLEARYEEKYNKKLNGKNLGQFHTDFDLEGAVGEIYATKSIFLGKKSYLDCLESKDVNGEIITGHHIRLKGITKEGLEHASKGYENSYEGLYEDLAKGNGIKFILNPFNKEENKQKVLFDFKKGIVSTKTEFTRMVKF